MPFRATDFLITPSDGIAVLRYFRDLSLSGWVRMFVLTLSTFIAYHFGVSLTNTVFLFILLWVFLFNVDARAPIKAALVCLVLIIVLLLLGKYVESIDADAWSESIAVWVYYFLAIGVLKQVKDHVLTDADGEEKEEDTVRTPASSPRRPALSPSFWERLFGPRKQKVAYVIGPDPIATPKRPMVVNLPQESRVARQPIRREAPTSSLSKQRQESVERQSPIRRTPILSTVASVPRFAQRSTEARQEQEEVPLFAYEEMQKHRYHPPARMPWEGEPSVVHERPIPAAPPLPSEDAYVVPEPTVPDEFVEEYRQTQKDEWRVRPITKVPRAPKSSRYVVEKQGHEVVVKVREERGW